MKKIIIFYLEFLLTILIYSIPISIIIKIISKQLGINQDILGVISAAGLIVFFLFFKPYLTKKKIVSNFVDKIIK